MVGALTDPRAYHRKKRRLRTASILTHVTFLACFARWGAHPLQEWSLGALSSDTGQRVIFISAFYLLWQMAAWPTRYLSGWCLEKEAGLLKQSFKGWLSDTGKSLALSFVFFLVSALVFYAVARGWPDKAWWVLAFLTFCFSAFFATVFPVWILPLFYHTSPLENGPLKDRLEEMLRRCGFPGLPLFVIRLGDKTVRENAMLAGLGRTRRALLSDTLLSHYTDDETAMVLSHEAGHHACGHVFRSLALEAFTAVAGFLALFTLFDNQTLLAIGFFPVLALLSYVAGLLSMPLTHSISRAHEREADRFALRHYPDFGVFRSLMEKLGHRNLADPSPGRLEEFVFYTHPSMPRRLAHAERFVRTSLANLVRPV